MELRNLNLAIFFCDRVDPDQDVNRREIEKDFGKQIRFYPLPCSGRIESIQLMRALESGSDIVYLLACPIGTCRYQEGNIRAEKRVEFTKKLVEEIGLEGDRIRLRFMEPPIPKAINKVVFDLIEKEEGMKPSPLRK